MPPTKPEDLRAQLRSVFSGAKVPTNPAIAAAILRLADDPSSTADQFAEVIRTDVALSARLLEVANGAMFAQREPVTTIKRAVMVLGLRRIRMLALGFQLVSHLDRLGDCPFDLNAFWQQSVLRGCLAREIAMHVAPGNAEEAFVIGLLQDCGILLLVQVLGRPYADLSATASLSPTAFYERERRTLPFNHIEAIRVLAEEWKLPDLIARPLGRHHDQGQHLAADADDVDRLSAVAYFVGSLALEDADNLAAAEPRLALFAGDELGMDVAGMGECLRRAGQAYTQIAPLLPEHLPATYDVADLLDRANRHLIRVATEAESRVEVVEAERDRFRREQRHLRTALGQYRDRAAHDPLTRLLNRGALMDAMLGTITEYRGGDLAIAVYFVDIDDFKDINDRFGHHTGDEVLRCFASAIGETIVSGGFAARYGGEEFVIVMPNLDEAEAQARARMMVDRVRAMRLESLGPARAVTCSVGAVWGHIRPGMAPADLFTGADALMYQAKLAGKNHCRFRSLAHPDAVTVLAHDRPREPAPAPLDPPAVVAAPASASSDDLHQLAMALNRTEPRRFATMRKRERQPLVAPARVHSFATGSDELVDNPGYVRNISTGGVGVLTIRPLIRGEPVEIAIESQDSPGQRLYVAGLVAHCRHVRGGIYEVGVQLVVQGRQPILSADGDEHLDWVVEALQASAVERPLRESA